MHLARARGSVERERAWAASDSTPALCGASHSLRAFARQCPRPPSSRLRLEFAIVYKEHWVVAFFVKRNRMWTCAPPCILRRAAAPPPQHTEPCWHCAGPNPHSIAHRDSAYGTDATTARAHRARATPSRTRPTNNQRREIRIMSLWRRSLPCTAHWPHLEAMRDGRVSAADSRVCKSTDLRGETVARWLMAVQ